MSLLQMVFILCGVFTLATFVICIIRTIIEWQGGEKLDWLYMLSGLFVIPLLIAYGIKTAIQCRRDIISEGGWGNYYRKIRREWVESKSLRREIMQRDDECKRIRKAFNNGAISRNQLPRVTNGIDFFEFEKEMGLYSVFGERHRDIVYVENEYCESLNGFFTRNADFKLAYGSNIIYLPRLTKEMADSELLRYKHPELPADVLLSESLPSTYPVQYLSYPEDAPMIKHGMMCFYGVYISCYGAYYIKGDYYPLEEGCDEYIKEQLNAIDLHFHEEDENDVVMYREVAKPNIKEGASDEYADELFQWVINDNNVAIIMDEVRERVRKLRSMGITEKILEKLIKSEPKLSRMVVTKDMRIMLPDYNDMEVKMEPINKAVYLLFLKHPEGILFKHLPDYRKELAEIYEKIKPLGLNERALKSIEDATNPCLNSINEKCARIRGAFVSRFEESLALHYYIYGERGRAKRIALPINLVFWE